MLTTFSVLMGVIYTAMSLHLYAAHVYKLGKTVNRDRAIVIAIVAFGAIEVVARYASEYVMVFEDGNLYLTFTLIMGILGLCTVYISMSTDNSNNVLLDNDWDIRIFILQFLSSLLAIGVFLLSLSIEFRIVDDMISHFDIKVKVFLGIAAFVLFISTTMIRTNSPWSTVFTSVVALLPLTISGLYGG